MDFDSLEKGATGERGLLGDGLMPGENEALYYLALYTKPSIVCEVGTRRGGGSTRLIAEALHKNKHGMLYTVEREETYYKTALALYDAKLKHLKPYVKFYLGQGHQVFPEVIKDFDKIDIIFLDGKNPRLALAEYQYFTPKVVKGTFLACHDWHHGKMHLLKPVIENCPTWEKLVDMRHTRTGFAIHRKT